MESDQVSGEFNDTLQDDAEQFGGRGESTAVPTHHIRVTSEDLAHFADTKEAVVIGSVALVWREDPPDERPDVDFVVFVSQNTLERLASGEVVNYGIHHIDGGNRAVHISKGGVSDLYGDERSPRERIQEEEPHLARYV